MIELIGKNLVELQKILQDNKFQKFRAKQIMDYVYKRFVFNFEEMLQLPTELRQWLSYNCSIMLPEVLDQKISPDLNTQKLLLKYADGSQIETVLMKQHYGNSICVSSQVGCAMGCIFCASTTGGLYRNLSVSEIVSQLLLFAARTKEPIHSLVVMGAGEPMQNYDNVIGALRFIHEDESFRIGYRRMTVSTCGLVEGINRLTNEGIPITLALSLHATSDQIRNQIMPISLHYKLADVLQAVRNYYEKTERRITFEYILIDGINSSEQDAHELGKIAKAFPNCNINAIPVNGNEHINLVQPSKRNMNKFKEIIESYGVAITIRKEMGDAIQAACGQLKAQHQ